MSVSVHINMSAFEQVDISSAMNEAVNAVEQAAQRYAPVKTGELRSSISGSVSGSTVANCTGRVSASARHAGFVEFGTSRMAAQPYLRPALSAI